MKKLFAIILTVALLLGLSVPTFAAESQTSTITVVMKDSGGDGWAEGAFGFLSLSTDELEFEDNSGHIVPKGITNLFTFESSTTATITHTVAKDEAVYFRWFDPEDASDEEASFNIYRDGVLQYSCDDVTKFDGSGTVYELFFTSYPDQRGMNVTYTVDPTYTVTIPATVTLGETAKIEVENVVVEKGKQVEVALTEANDFKVATNEGAELTYTVKNGETEVAEGETVLAVNPKDSKTGETTLSFVAPTEIQYAGTYTGSATFTIAVKDAPKTIINFTMDSSDFEEWIPDLTANLQAEAGMTWAEWIESDYNVDDYVMTEYWDGSYIICPEGENWVAVRDPQIDGFDGIVLSTDEIVADNTYTLIQILG